MNSLYSCSWVQKTQVLNESYLTRVELLNEELSKTLGDVKKKMEKIKIGVPYRDARLFFYQFLQDKFADRLPQKYVQSAKLPKEQALETIYSTFEPEHKISRIKSEDGEATYSAKSGGRQYLITLKEDEGRGGKMQIQDIKPENLKSAEVLISKKLTGSEVNALYNEMISGSDDPEKLKKEIDELFKKYAEEKQENSNDDRVTWYLNHIATPREYRGVRGAPLPVDTKKRELASLADIRSAMSPEAELEEKEFEPGGTGYETLKLNLSPNNRLMFVMPGMNGNEIYKTQVGKYEYRVNLSGLGGRDVKFADLQPEQVKSVNVYDLSAPKTTIDEPPVKGEVPKRVYSGDEIDYSKIPETEEDLIEPEEVAPEDDIYDEEDGPEHALSGRTSDWDAEDEEEHAPNCKCLKCMSKPKTQPQQTQVAPTEITIKLSPQALNKQMQEAYRLKQQHMHRVDRRNMLGY